ncbi:polyamine ABC transporter permease [Pseudoclavibacter sp. AY1F1]|uniref:ABC transporter permease n=1 Tax=Pseudoclavibacter sp. AY1F1 TaxID=2080583 RepID=UPI000CE8E7F2|nr:ABC transporter permease [Pseudoclavibacter sp. AY1F1]PPF43614.1 polyamine ABC transporter permease [Pseudoclavibacter sp. AY1F1]
MKLKVVLGIISGLVAAWLILPTLVLVPISFSETASFNFPAKGFSLQWYENFFTDLTWVRSLLLSLQVGVLATIIATVTGTLAAFGLSKMRIRGRALFEGYLLTPMMIPGIVLAVGLYAVFLQFGLLGTVPGFVLAHTVLALPFVIVNVLTSLEGVDSRLELAAASLGANRTTTFFRIVLPLIAPGVGAGALFAFVTSFDEVIVSLFIQSPGLQTLPVKVFRSVTQDTDPTVAAVSVIVTVFSILAVSVAQLRFVNRKRQQA